MIKAFFGSIFGGVKKNAGYVCYTFGVTLFFLYILFPESLGARWTMSFCARQKLPVEIRVRAARPRLPLAWEMTDMDLLDKGKPLTRLNRVTVFPDWGALITGTPGIKARMDAAGGEVLVNAAGDFPEMETFQARFSHVDLSRIPGIGNLGRIGLAGQVSGRIDLVHPMAADRSGTVDMTGHAISVNLDHPMAVISRLDVTQMTLETTIAGDQVAVDRGGWVGSPVSGDISGSFALAAPASRSRLSLKLRLRPGETVPAGADAVISMLFGAPGAPKTAGLELTGTFQSPKVSMK